LEVQERRWRFILRQRFAVVVVIRIVVLLVVMVAVVIVWGAAPEKRRPGGWSLPGLRITTR